MAEQSKEDKKKKGKEKDNALRRFILRRKNADKIIGGLEGKTPAEVEEERRKSKKKPDKKG